MEKDKEYELIVHEGKRPLWQIAIASVLYTIVFVLIGVVIMLFYNYGLTDITLKKLPVFAYCIVYFLLTALGFSLVKSVLIDLDTDKLVTRFNLGPFTYEKISPVPHLEYVSIFKKKEYDYQVNLWYKGNKHFIMCDFNTSEPAFEFGHYVANKLNLDLLNATEKGNHQWISVKPIEEINL